MKHILTECTYLVRHKYYEENNIKKLFEKQNSHQSQSNLYIYTHMINLQNKVIYKAYELTISIEAPKRGSINNIRKW